MSKHKVEMVLRKRNGESVNNILPGQPYTITADNVAESIVGASPYVYFVGRTYRAFVDAERVDPLTIAFTTPADLPSIGQEFVSVGAMPHNGHGIRLTSTLIG
jgi:hypothetical protein